MDTKSNKSSTDSTKKTLLLRDFVVDDEERFVYSSKDHDLMFFSAGSAEKLKRYIQVWYKEEDKRYLRDESIMDWNILKYRWQIDERNRKFWDKINNFYQEYFDE